ncbi:MAG: type II toxin-antitoxin system RelE/ParE family toxin [Candidatus Firestonebacteria bacterium]
MIILAAQRDLDNIVTKEILLRLKKSMQSLADNPRPHGCIKLMDKEGGYRIRVSDYRCCYRIDDFNKLIYIYRVKHRREVYR